MLTHIQNFPNSPTRQLILNSLTLSSQALGEDTISSLKVYLNSKGKTDPENSQILLKSLNLRLNHFRSPDSEAGALEPNREAIATIVEYLRTAILAIENVDGLLVGKASLDVGKFVQICLG